jgi:hypothetical protein
MADKIVEVRFGGQELEYLALAVRGRAYRQSREYWDGNWLLVTAAIRVGKFSGEIPGMLRAEELQTFTQALQTFQQSLKGLVSFETAEEWLHFHLEADKLGRIEISGTITDEVSYPYNSLKFTLTTNQSLLAAPLKQLQTVTQAFPVVGKP